MKANNILLVRLAELYRDFRKAGGTQADVSRVTGLKQSTVSRYMTGSMPLNDKFLSGFMEAIGKSYDELKPYMVNSDVINVIYTLSGTKISEDATIMAISIDKETVFGIRVDENRYGLRNGTILIVSKTAVISELDNVVLINENTNDITYGVLEYKPDIFKNGFAVREQYGDTDYRFVEVTDDLKLYYVAGVQYPKNEGRRTFNR